LRIEPAVTTDKELGQQSLDPLAYVRWLIGPMEAMMNVRSTSQLERGHLEADLVEVYLDASNGQSDDSNSPRQDTELRKRWFEGPPNYDRLGRLKKLLRQYPHANKFAKSGLKT
jgi:hypothetical protein